MEKRPSSMTNHTARRPLYHEKKIIFTGGRSADSRAYLFADAAYPAVADLRKRDHETLLSFWDDAHPVRQRCQADDSLKAAIAT